MNDEELLKLTCYTTQFNHELMELNIKYSEEIERLNKDLKDACEVIERLKEDKKKAIEYLNNCGIDEETIKHCKNYDVNGIDIFNILRGESNEDN